MQPTPPPPSPPPAFPVKFTRTDGDGKPRTRFAYNQADLVQLRFDGWAEHVEADAAPARATVPEPVRERPRPPAAEREPAK